MPLATLRYSDETGHHTVPLDRATISIGRSPSQDVVLNDPAVSRRHATLEREGSTLMIVDQGSTHGTFVNGVRVQRAELKAGYIVQCGSPEGMAISFHGEQTDSRTILIGQGSFGDLLSSMKGIRADDARPAAQEMEQLNWLLRAARQLNEGGAIEEILQVLLQLTLQLTGVERGFVFLNDGGTMHFAQGLGADGKIEKEDLTISRRAMQTAIESETKFSVSDTLSSDHASDWSSVLINNIRSIYCIPLRKRTATNGPAQLLGLLYLDSQLKIGHLSEVDHQLLDTIATEAAGLLHNALLAEQESKARQAREELAVAASIHSSLMSTVLPVLSYAELQARSVPCLAIGGDFYDAVAMDDSVCVSVVDVSGKGVSAAIVAATLQGIIHAQLMARQSLVEIATLVNRFLCERNVGKYATMIMVRLFSDGRVEYLNCGHIQPLAILGVRVRQFEESNMIVGLIAGAQYASTFDLLQPGERILLATDGVTEAEDTAGTLFSDAGLNEAVLNEDIGVILDQIARFQAPNQAQDDCTLLSIRYKG